MVYAKPVLNPWLQQYKSYQRWIQDKNTDELAAGGTISDQRLLCLKSALTHFTYAIVYF